MQNRSLGSLLLTAAVIVAGTATPRVTHAAGVAADPDRRYFELRIYDVIPGKMDAVLERFGGAVARLQARHGLGPVGYWTGQGADGRPRFVYILSAPSKAAFQEGTKAFAEDPEFKAAYAASEKKHGRTFEKIETIPLSATDWSPKIDASASSPPRAFELRVYGVLPGKMDAYLANYRDARLKLFEKHGFTNLGFWTGNDTNKPGSFVMLLAHPATGSIEQAKAAYHADPEWKTSVDGWNEKTGPTTTNVLSLILAPAAFSPTK